MLNRTFGLGRVVWAAVLTFSVVGYASSASAQSSHARIVAARAAIAAIAPQETMIQYWRRLLAEQSREKTPEEIATNIYVEKKVEALAPVLVDRFVQLYADLFDETQLREIAQFFSSPTGRRLNGLAAEVVQERATEPEPSSPQTGKEAPALDESLIFKLGLSGLSNADQAEILAFQRSPAGEALRAKRAALVAGAADNVKFITNFATHVRMERFCDTIHCTARMRGWIDRDLPLSRAEQMIADSP